MWMMLQQDQHDDYVLATGEAHSVREFVELAFRCINRPVLWDGAGLDEKGRCAGTGEVLVKIDPRYYRPTEVDVLLGDPTKARAKLGWRHKTSFPTLIAEMVAADRALIQGGGSDDEREELLRVAG
jgi:GDPmannose 4,6-dehydratase